MCGRTQTHARTYACRPLSRICSCVWQSVFFLSNTGQNEQFPCNNMLPFRTRAVRVHFVLSSRNGVSEVVVVSIRNPNTAAPMFSNTTGCADEKRTKSVFDRMCAHDPTQWRITARRQSIHRSGCRSERRSPGKQSSGPRACGLIGEKRNRCGERRRSFQIFFQQRNDNNSLRIYRYWPHTENNEIKLKIYNRNACI